jgi:hypothetical protein
MNRIMTILAQLTSTKSHYDHSLLTPRGPDLPIMETVIATVKLVTSSLSGNKPLYIKELKRTC